MKPGLVTSSRPSATDLISAIRPRGLDVSTRVSRYVGQVGRHSPQRTQRLKTSDAGMSGSVKPAGTGSITATLFVTSVVDPGAFRIPRLRARPPVGWERKRFDPAGVREDLARIHDPVRIDGLLDPAHQGDLIFAQIELEELLFEQTDPVLARQRPAQCDGGLEDLACRGDDAPHLVGVAAIAEDIGMEIPVPGVAEEGDHEPVTLGDLTDAPGHLGYRRARDRDVFAELVRTAPRQGR